MLRSEYVPVAVNCSPAPTATSATGGVTAMATRLGVIGIETGVTVNAATPDRSELESAAVIVTAPVATPVARPWEPAALEIVAVVAADEDHVTWSVRSRVLRSEYVPVAVNCSVAPAATVATGGVTAMATRVAGRVGPPPVGNAGVTVSAAVPDTSAPGAVAVMVATPVPAPVARPCEPAAFDTVAVLDDDVDHVTVSVRFFVVRSE